mmetsp:Transcript_23903/g.94818  ORF Transcript_23903/g.94818 Transcript_23903/m.94818 type:complete len:310 (+) Transcript_23903:292-1221(+)
MDRLLLGPYAIAVTTLAWLAVRGPPLSTSSAYRERWFGSSAASRWCLALYFAKTSLDALVQLATMRLYAAHAATNKRLEVLAHHVVSSFCFGYSLFATRQCEFFGCLAALSEGSTPFLNAVMAVKLFTGERKAAHRALVAANGVGLWVAYVACRLVVFPVWFWRWVADLRGPHAAELVARVSAVQLLVYPASTACIFALSCFWFGLITQGLLKALGLLGAATKIDDGGAVVSIAQNNNHEGVSPPREPPPPPKSSSPTPRDDGVARAADPSHRRRRPGEPSGAAAQRTNGAPSSAIDDDAAPRTSSRRR